MIRVPGQLIFMGILATVGLLGGCGPRYDDTLNPRYADFGVKKIGLVIWCDRYVSEDPASVDFRRLDPLKSRMKKTDTWDLALTPLITAQVQLKLRELGYEVVDASPDAPFGPEVKTANVLEAVRAKHPQINAVLLMSYIVSPLNTMATASADDPMGSVAVDIQTQRQTQTNYGNYAVIHTVTRDTKFTGANEVGGTNLRGLLKLVQVPTGEVLWEIGNHSVYGVYSAKASSKKGISRDEVTKAVCRQFGTVFTEPAVSRQGFPPR